MNEFKLNSISPIDGRYFDKTKDLNRYFSEKALIFYRINFDKSVSLTKLSKFFVI